MRVLFLIITFFVSSVWADTFTSRIYEIDRSPEMKQPHIVKFENGRIAFLSQDQADILLSLKESKNNNDELEIQVDEDYDLISAATVENGQGYTTRDIPERKQVNYIPSVLNGLASARSVFSRMKRGYQNDSQCYNRAHIWSYEEFKHSGLKSMKLFLFFTSRYIRNYRYKWWFHVSPMAMVKEGTAINRRVLDRRYTKGPLFVNTWTNIFIQSGRKCPVVSKYSQYSNNQQAQDCYLIPASQHYWQPRDLERYEWSGYEKTSFLKSEVDYAYWEAF